VSLSPLTAWSGAGDRWRRLLARCAVPTVCALSCGLGLALASESFLPAEQILLALWQERLPAPPLPKPLRIVAIDDQSLNEALNADLQQDPLLRRLGPWPWPRQAQARVLDRLAEAGAQAVAIDLFFVAPSHQGAGDDGTLARSIAAFPGPRVLAAKLLEPIGQQGAGDGVAGFSLISPLATLLSRGAVAGLTNAEQDTIRRPAQRHVDLMRASIPLVLPDSLAQTLHRRTGGALPRSPGPLWERYLRFHGPAGTIPTLSIWQLLADDRYQRLRTSGELRGALVFIGPTASSLQDLHPIGWGQGITIPGVEIHATEFANLRQGSFWHLLRPAPLWAVPLALAVLAYGLALQQLSRPLARLAVGLGACLGLAAVAGGLLAGFGVGIPLFTLLLSTALVTVTSSAEASVRVQLDRLRLRRTLRRYLSPAVAEEVMRQGESWSQALQGRRCEVVVLMTDVRGFTAMTSRYAQQGREAELVGRLNDYFAMVVAELLAEGATVDKFIGDATLAYFGAPLSRGIEADAQAALAASRRIVHGLERLNRHWAEQGLEPWQQVVVLSAGTVICGNIGSPERQDYTVIGDAVNRASRLEAVAKQTGATIVASQAVVERLGPGERPLALGDFPIRGQEVQPVYGISAAPEP